jgi:hypothetical protein
MALIGFAPALRCPCDGTLLVGKDVQPLQSIKPIRMAVSTVLEESWCGHKTSVWDVGCFLGVSCFRVRCVAVCLGLLRTGSPVVPLWFSSKTTELLSYKNDLRKPFRNEPLHE